MTKQPVTVESLASLLDGTLPTAERERLLARLAEDDSAYELLIESAAVARDAGVLGGRPKWRRWLPVGLAAAAAVALLALRFGWTESLTGSALPLARAAALGVHGPINGDPGVPAQWPRMYGTVDAARPGVFSARGTAFRLGLGLTHLEMAAEAADSGSVRAALSGLRDLAAYQSDNSNVLEFYEAMSARAGLPSREERSRAARMLRKLVSEPEWIELGATVEAARIAAASGQAGFFDPGQPAVRTLRRLTNDIPPDGPMVGDFTHLFRVFVDDLSADPRPSLPKLQARLTELILLGGR